MSKLQFRARALDASKPMPIYMAEELPDLTDYSAINRAVPQMPSGMEKEEECEHHLQRAICTGLIIPTPEVANMADVEAYDKIYPANYKQPRQLIHMQPFTMEQDIPDYDMDSEDEAWVGEQARRLDLTPLKFESMMDRLEKSSGQTVVTLHDAKALLKEDDDLIIAIFDYWLNKRLKTQHPLILAVKTEHRLGSAANNPYLAFRRRTEKMQTRKNRKNDETSYEKMLKLRRDLTRAVTLLELVKRREKTKREHLHLTIEVMEKRYQAQDFSGAMLSEVSALRAASRPAFAPLFTNQFTNQNWVNKIPIKDEIVPRKEKRQYKKRKHKSATSHVNRNILGEALSSDDDDGNANTILTSPEEPDVVDPDEGRYTFKRNKHCSYHMPRYSNMGNWPWCSAEENGFGDRRYRYTLTSIRQPKPRCIGFARRRVGRGGRVILDRVSTAYDDLWREMDFTIIETPSLNERLALERALDSSESVVEGGVSDEGDVEMQSVDVKPSLDINKTINSVLNDRQSCSSSGGVSGGVAPSPALRNLYSEHNYNSTTSASGFINNYSDSGSVCRVKHETDIAAAAVRVKEEPHWNNGDLEVQTKSEPSYPPPRPSSVTAHSDTDNRDVTRDESQSDFIFDLIKEMKQEWLHFRPKTPPSDYEAPCYLLPAKDDTFNPSDLTPLIVETESLLPTPPLMLDNVYQSTFTSEFTLNDIYMDLSLDAQMQQQDLSTLHQRPASPTRTNISTATVINSSYTNNASLLPSTSSSSSSSSTVTATADQLGFLLNDTRQEVTPLMTMATTGGADLNCSDSNNCISSTNNVLNDLTQFGCSRVSLSCDSSTEPRVARSSCERINKCANNCGEVLASVSALPASTSALTVSSTVPVRRNIQLVQNALQIGSASRLSLQTHSILSSTLTSPNKFNNNSSTVNNSVHGVLNSNSTLLLDRVTTANPVVSTGVRISTANLVNVRPLDYPLTNGPSTSLLDVSMARRVNSKPLPMDESLSGGDTARIHWITNNSNTVNSQVRRALHTASHNTLNTLNSNSANNSEVSSSSSPLITEKIFLENASNLQMKSAIQHLQQKNLAVSDQQQPSVQSTGTTNILHSKPNSQHPQPQLNNKQNTQTNNKSTAQSNSKQQIVRKNNTLAMEVT